MARVRIHEMGLIKGSGGNYQRQIELMGQLLEPGDKLEVLVTHDGDCGLARGAACDCQPEIVVTNFHGGKQHGRGKES